ncbi:MAG TPA: glycoside hydrolase family 44 protein [Ktedonobacteraceae bacterium]|nr:glycoside hydrolase family 44 protein [Ktedonobacteraceae bacterium]
MFSNYQSNNYYMNDINAKSGMPLSGGRNNAGNMPEKQKKKRNTPLILLSLLIVAALLIAAVRVAANLFTGDTTLVVQVAGQQSGQIDLSQSYAISPGLLGSNVFPRSGTNSKDQADSGFMSYDQQVILGLQSARIKLLRFPGGNWGEQHTLSHAQMDDFSALLNQVGAQGIMQVQLSDPNDVTPVDLQTRATRAALLVDYMNNSKSIQRLDPRAAFHPITYWTIGNEPDLLINPDTHQKFTVDEYTHAFIIFSLAMHQKDPGIKIFGPEVSTYLGQQGPKDARGKLWVEDFLRLISAFEQTHNLPFHVLDGVSFHDYPFGFSQVNSGALLQNPEQWDSILPSLHQFIRQQFGEDLPIAITEINTNAGKFVPPQNLAAIWWADTLGKLMANQVQYVTFFSTEGVDSPYPLFLKQGLQETAMLRTMQLFSQLQPDFVPIQGANGQVSMYATEDQQHATVSVLFINKTGASQKVSVKSSSFLPVGPWQQANLTIPAYGMVMVTLHKGGGDEALSFSSNGNAQQAAPAIQHLVCGNNQGSTNIC